jgi:hypothetical protein
VNQIKELLKSNSARIGFEAIKSDHANEKHFKRILLDHVASNFTACYSCFIDDKQKTMTVLSGMKLSDGQFS